ncbi:LPXTG-motif cell wall anchor domain-containing protein [Lysinibacillus sp. AC-3]|uniref:collagen binding domain-containing protein n=1 Tax=unclassified Lysinibacillus TaxID=2636778 RepID=UPI0009CA9462|nr:MULTISPECIES: collagen binding domain-containing protein [unclassified Lysinibacillus]SKB27221.1 LPXTG-motif cell wall anchor domain-containing protein [Lysinibacillus sp. AC-3]
MRKFKKLNIAIILMLLVFQTVLSPISVFAIDGAQTLAHSAESGDVGSSDNTRVGESPETSTEPEKGDGSITGTTGVIELPETSTGSEKGDGPITGSEGVVELPETSTGSEKGDDPVTGSTGVGKLPETQTEPEKGDVSGEGENPKEDKDDETTPPSYDQIMSVDVIKNVEFTVDGKKVSPNESINVSNGQSAEFKFHLELEAGHNYGPGTTLTYTLPDIFENITFPKGTAYGEVGTISKSGNDIVITFNEALRDDVGTGVALEPGAYFSVQANFASGNTEWEETISLPGTENIKLNFQPKTSGKPVSKSGVADNGGKNSKFIDWTVDVNTDLRVNEASGTSDFVDTLEGAHTFKQDSVKITKLNVSPNGAITVSNDPVIVTPIFDNNKMTIALPNEKHTAYRITYQTEVGDAGNVNNAIFENEATYNGKSTTVSVNVSFGDPLAKTHTGPTASDLRTYWTIKYNFNNRNISQENAVLTDIWTDTQELVGEVQVFEADGNTPAAISYKVDKDGNSFKLKFNAPVTKPYVIKYVTKPKDGVYPTESFTVKNEVSRPDMSKPVEDYSNYNKINLLLNKSANGIDYQNKTMSWKIVANQAGYNLAAGTVFTDDFTDRNLTLKVDTLEVKIGNKPLVSGKDYTLTNKDKAGFEITLNDEIKEPIVITYDTEYDIRHAGSNTIEYHNKVTMTNDNLPKSPSASAEQEIRTEQKTNGKKEGHYNYETKTFYWDVEFNFNYNSLKNAVFEDKLPDTQKVQNIVVQKGELNASGVFTGTETIEIPNTSGKPNEIKLELGDINSPYKVTYESVDEDGIFPHGNPVRITNTATLTSDEGENASWSKTVDVNHTDKILNKMGHQADRGSAVAKWNFEFNYAQSKLDNVVITDTVGKDEDGNPEQMILEDTFRIYKVALSGTTPSNPAEKKTLLDPSEYTLNVDMKNGTFTLNLGDVTAAYYIEYETVFTGESGSDAENEVEVSYQGGSQTSGKDSWSIADFNYGNQASTVKVPFVILKTNAATGEVMQDVEFTLYSQYTGNKPLVSAKTDENGVLDFGLKLAEGKYTLKETKVDGFENPDVIFTLNRDEKATSGPFEGKQIVEIANIPESPLKCSLFELTVYDIDGKLVDGTVTLVSKATGLSENHTVKNGKVTFTPDQVKAGQYDVIYNGETLKTITVEYSENCNASIQPAPKCENFTIVVKDTDGNIRTNIKELTLKSGTTEVKASTDASGKFIFESNKTNADNGVKPGEYTVYEGNQFLGTVTLTYTKDCGHEFIVEQAPKCEEFKLTVKDVDGNNITDGTSTIVVKDADGNEIISTKTTTGVIELTDLEPGIYTVEVNGEKIGTFETNIECEKTVQPAPKCELFTLTVKDENGNPRPNVSNITIKDKATGAIIATNQTTNELGQITIQSKDIPSGEYSVYQGDLFIGQITVKYSVKCEAEVSAAPACPSFTLTVLTELGTPNVNAKITIKDAKGNIVKDADGNEVLTTSIAGTVLLPNEAIKQGTYNVYDGTSLIGSFTVKDTCAATVKPKSTSGGGGGGWTPNPDPGKPVDPDPEKPVDPKPDPEKPVDPEKPTPEPEKPVDPEKPTKPKPDPEKPVNPTNPGGSGNETDPKDPTNPTKPEKPTVEEVIDQGKELKPYNPSTADKDTLDEYNGFLDKYNKLSKEEQAEVDKYLDIDKIKADAKEMEAQLNAQGKLPQTNGANQTALTLIGVALVLGALFLLRRRNTEVK